jgi:hypothetical protein
MKHPQDPLLLGERQVRYHQTEQQRNGRLLAVHHLAQFFERQTGGLRMIDGGKV